jgi:hypothetical protein
MLLSRIRDDIVNIVRSYGYEGEIADMLVDALSYYASEHLLSLAGQYYNSSLFKSKNQDAVLQLGLDHSVPVYRGENASVILRIQTTGPLTLAPLQEVFSYGKHYFYVKSKRYVQIPGGTTYDLELVYADQQAAIVENKISLFDIKDKDESLTILLEEDSNSPYQRGARNFISNFYIINDKLPISEDVALYAIYTKDNNNYNVLLPYTNKPTDFYFFSITYEFNASDLVTELYPILVLTTPRYGINIRLNHRYIIRRLASNVVIRTVYLNYTENLPPDDVLSLLIDHVNRNFPVVPSGTVVLDVLSHKPPTGLETNRYRIAEWARYNGVIRSVSDINHWFLNFSDVKIYDAKLITKINPETTSNTNMLSLTYYILYISGGYVSNNDIIRFIQNHASYIYAALPTLPINVRSEVILDNSFTTNYTFNLAPAGVSLNNSGYPCPPGQNCFSIEIIQVRPITVSITATYIGSYDVNLVRQTYRRSLESYTMRIIESIDPMVLFSLFTRVAHVNSVLRFAIFINNAMVFSVPNTTNSNNDVIKLIDYDTIGTSNPTANYIASFDLEGITAYNAL